MIKRNHIKIMPALILLLITFGKVSTKNTSILFSNSLNRIAQAQEMENTVSENGEKPEEANGNSSKDEVLIEVFWAIGCPHCAEEKQFVQKLVSWRDDVVVKEYEISANRQNALLMRDYGERLGADTSGVPFTVINKEYYIVGYGSPQTTGLEILNKVREIQGEEPLKSLNQLKENDKEDQTNNFSFLFFKDIDLEKASLPLLTVVLALADGFNPCAMWVLLFLISLLLGMENKRRRWIIGGTFILASGLVYFLFLTAWLKFFLFVGMIKWVRYIIGAVALTAAFLYLRGVIREPEGCKVVGGNEGRKQIFSKLREYALKDNLLVALMGIILLAFAVNLVELVCSAGLPATYSNILAMNDLSMLSYYGYMALYVIIFMIDDFAIFSIAMVTLHAVGLESKYAKIAHFVGGALMLFIGLSMFLKPELLMFG